jgi:16S rRNA (uracil1498-N3)-methyltransferase
VRNPLQADTELLLDDEAARHVQVLRLQPGMWLELFNGEDGCYPAQVLHMGRQQVQVLVHSFSPDVASLACRSQLVLGMPANERMDWLVEKATELGVSRITPLMTQRTVLKLQGERALKRQLHCGGGGDLVGLKPCPSLHQMGESLNLQRLRQRRGRSCQR